MGAWTRTAALGTLRALAAKADGSPRARSTIDSKVDAMAAVFRRVAHDQHPPADEPRFPLPIPFRNKDAAIVRAVIDIARSLKLEVAAGGVETEAQLAFLREHGCEAAKGFLFSEPLPPDAFERLLRDWGRAQEPQSSRA